VSDSDRKNAALGLRGRKWLKAVHLVFVAMWLAGGVSLILLNTIPEAKSGEMLHGLDTAKRVIDDLVVVTGAMGAMVTGVAFGIFTKWGFTRHRWVIGKWIITVVGIFFGTFYLGPRLNALAPVSAELGLAALKDPGYLRNLSENLWGAVFQVSTLLVAIWLSVFKPRLGSRSKQARDPADDSTKESPP